MLTSPKTWFMVFVSCILIMLIGISSSSAQESGPDAILAYMDPADSQVTIDGTIETGEYPVEYNDFITGIRFYSEHDGTNMSIGMVASVEGWLGIGFGPQGFGMADANLIVGLVDDDGEAFTYDGVGDGQEFVLDEDFDGVDDLIEFACTQQGGVTTVEFIYPLETNDTNDQNMVVDETFGFFIAYQSDSDDFNVVHSEHSPILDLFVSKEPVTPTMLFFAPNQDPLRIGEVSSIIVYIFAGNDSVESGRVSFYRQTTFGLLLLGTVDIQYGMAHFDYKPTVTGGLYLIAQFHSTGLYPSTSSRTSVIVEGESEAGLHYFSHSKLRLWRNPFVILAMTVVLGVWTVILSSLNLISNLAGAGAGEAETLAKKSKESQDGHETDDTGYTGSGNSTGPSDDRQDPMTGDAGSGGSEDSSSHSSSGGHKQ